MKNSGPGKCDSKAKGITHSRGAPEGITTNGNTSNGRTTFFQSVQAGYLWSLRSSMVAYDSTLHRLKCIRQHYQNSDVLLAEITPEEAVYRAKRLKVLEIFVRSTITQLNINSYGGKIFADYCLNIFWKWFIPEYIGNWLIIYKKCELKEISYWLILSKLKSCRYRKFRLYYKS